MNNNGLCLRYVEAGVPEAETSRSSHLVVKSLIFPNKRSIQSTLVIEIETMKYENRTGV